MTSSNVKIGAKPSHGVVASLHFAVLILFTDCYTETGRKFAALMAVIARDFRPKSNFWLVITLNFHREKTSLSN